MKYKSHNNPKISYMLLQLMLLWLSFWIVTTFMPFVAKNPTEKYFSPYLVYIVLLFFCGIAFRKYHSYRKQNISRTLNIIFRADLLALLICLIVILIFPSFKLSVYAFYAFVGVLFVLEVVFASVYSWFVHAIDVEHFYRLQAIEEPETKPIDNQPLGEEDALQLSNVIEKEAGPKVLQHLKNKTDLLYSNTKVVELTTDASMQVLENASPSLIINLARINNVRGINDFFVAIYDKLPYKGTFVGCFRPKNHYKKDFLSRYPRGINYAIYSLNYMVKRFFPKWVFTRELYFWLTNGRKRILAKPEVYGRLYAAGFAIESDFKVGDLIYFIAKKVNEPIRDEIINYGPIIKLKRVGKGAKTFDVYKFRTMHPYSEFLQPYIYERNKLSEGGKFRHDIRITSLGAFMRRYWLDELPMLLNLLKGDMKLVGIRPLSKHYFGLYSKELQKKRSAVKPGLLPPFYADMPKTLDEIQSSEMKYLLECEKKGTLVTDLKYFGLICGNILLKRARSK